ncbi:N-carbamoyl-L-amino acid amidohydrolase [Rudanella paleaurantiibacter]|uniref:N-carbamoyl-L-amino acid amidohydrolase n=1 Tax=Rudanella paleaurantiibacter TaxID=2614655 RepID=A0A7J5U3D2_9BACT|nr:N-carbamoyl-L-amino acid amidohydrolase [Rudanella paleaurantiibacter]KAB7732002.1 N-carbamoyl-L-amino acid amidohydrolase [Rudanella paleaurantiibacter]
MGLAYKNPYLINNRLADVIAAIQVMGTYKFYKLPFDKWADRISGTTDSGIYWKEVFEEHPEFFRLDGNREKASLVWRRQYPKRYHVDQEKKLSQSEYEKLSEKDKQERISRVPLTSEDIKALVSTAISLHSRALEEEKESRWWIPLLVSGGGGLLGALLGAFFRK